MNRIRFCRHCEGDDKSRKQSQYESSILHQLMYLFNYAHHKNALDVIDVFYLA